ncbi:hypothetical protein DH2020_028776 [Rehmannia glutinosa]|uniref:DUF4005 domain-containing protein n=1 Tax=Rehmannia glutinosa TaxID=99300 RepID=A0ABR0VSA7_REHGL
MGKASKWFRGLLGLKNTDTNHNHAQKPPPKKKWSFAKSHKENDRQKSRQSVAPGGDDDNDASKHAIAVAAATAAVAEAAVAAAQAAAAVVQLTSSGRNIPTAGGGGRGGVGVTRRGAVYGSREEWAAVMVQSHFRAYLSRRALRALKALVKLQALVRGHLVRKQTAYALRRLQALVRAQVRARSGRVLMSESPHSSMKSSHFNYLRNGSKSRSSRIRLDSRMVERSSEQGSFTTTTTNLHTDDDKIDKILEVDTGNPHVTSKNRTFSTSVLSVSSGEVQSLSPLKFTQNADESAFCTADNSPTFYSASSRGGGSKKGAFTPTKSDCSRSCLSGYSDHPNYMSYTESSKAKVRSLSARNKDLISRDLQVLRKDIRFMDMAIRGLRLREFLHCMLILPAKLIRDRAVWTGLGCRLEVMLLDLVVVIGIELWLDVKNNNASVVIGKSHCKEMILS